jgi:hypothetical protein
MRIFVLIGSLAAGAFVFATITPAAAFAPGLRALAATYQASAAVADQTVTLVAVKRPPGWHHGRKTGWHGRGLPPGQLKKRRF